MSFAPVRQLTDAEVANAVPGRPWNPGPVVAIQFRQPTPPEPRRPSATLYGPPRDKVAERICETLRVRPSALLARDLGNGVVAVMARATGLDLDPDPVPLATVHGMAARALNEELADRARHWG